jgi:predicted lipoprotein with Yx(FWY)xxD motif
MMGSRRTIALVATVAGLMLLLAACASKTNTGGISGSTPAATGAGRVTVQAAQVGIIGTALVNGEEETLYMLTADHGGKPSCTSSPCTGLWPPLLVPTGGTAVAGSGITASKLGTVDTPSGAKQVTYNNLPLYTYSGDSGPKQSNGQGIQSFGGTWHPVSPSGSPIVGGASTAPSSTSSSSTSGYPY